MASGRRSTVSLPRALAREVPKSVELELRLARLELQVKDLTERLDIQTNRSAALQAQVDHLLARLFHT